MMSDDALITICLPTYRRPTMLSQCLHSCLAQDYRLLEIDVADSSPNDDTRDLVEAIVPPEGVRLRYRRLPPDTEPQAKTNLLFAAARGRRLLVIHDDDALMPGAVAALDRAFRSAPDVVLAYGREEIIDEAGEVLPGETLASNAEAWRTPDQAGLRRDLLVCALARQVPPNAFLVGSDEMRRIGYRPRAEIGLAEDTDFGVRLALAHCGSSAFAFLGRVVARRRLMRSSLGWTAPDTCRQLYGELAAMRGLSPEEERARDWTLRRLARPALRENALGGRRRDALRIFLSRHYPRDEEGAARTLYSLGLLAAPRAASALRRMAGAG
jgi:glycosyltransferase involved in cell wall biosynthesis